MPGTIQELASMFRKAIDSQGNVLDMGVVKEVVAALERSPVSARDLNDLKSTRLGKYINQVRRAIPEKSLAKRMKKLVIQWRNIAQRSPGTPNGVPTQTRPTPPPSPTSPLTTNTIHTMPQLKPDSPTSHTLAQARPSSPTVSSDQRTPTPPSSLTPHTVTASSRPSPSVNPALSRKRALHRLSKLTSQPQKTLSSTAPQHTLSPTPPFTSHTPSPSTHRPPSPVTKPFFSTDKTTVPSTDSPSSLHVRFPLHSVVKSLIVKISLVNVHVSSLSSQPSETANGGLSDTDSRPQETMRLPTSDCDMARAKEWLVAANSSEGKVPPLHGTTSGEDRTAKPLTLIVSIDRDSLKQPTHPARHPFSSSVSGSVESAPGTTPESTFTPLTWTSDTSTTHKEESTHCIRVRESSLSERGSLCSDGVWRRWTDVIVHEDSLAVNVLPYVYVDGLNEGEEITDYL